MRKQFFKMLNKLNKALLPKVNRKDPLTFTKMEKALVAYKYYVLVNSLD